MRYKRASGSYQTGYILDKQRINSAPASIYLMYKAFGVVNRWTMSTVVDFTMSN